MFKFPIEFRKMGCSGSKHDKLDVSDDSYTVTVTPKKSNRKTSSKVKSLASSEQIKSKQTKAKQQPVKATTVAPTIHSVRNGDQIDGNKVTVQRSASPPPLKPAQQQVTKHHNSTQSTRPATTRKSGWTDEQLLSQLQYLDFDTSTNIVRLFDEGNTIPFMCRYRRELIGNFDADKYMLN